jgi:hypothetical protein
MLPNDAYIRGMCVYLFGRRQDIYRDVASRIFGVNILTTIPFDNTMAISSEIGLKSGQLKDLRSLLKTQGVKLDMPDREVEGRDPRKLFYCLDGQERGQTEPQSGLGKQHGPLHQLDRNQNPS